MTERGVASSVPRHIDHYLSMSRSELTILAAEDLGEMAFEIQCYAYWLQGEQNKQLAKADKCKFETERIVGPTLENYKHIYGKEEKMLAAISDNEGALSYKNIETHARAAATRTSYLPQRLENIARSLLDLANTKRRHNA